MRQIESDITLRDIIDFVNLYVEEDSICDNYSYLLDCCRTIGISSYTLNQLISSAKENLNKNADHDLGVPYMVYVKSEKETKYVEVKEIQYEHYTEKKWKVGLFSFSIVLIFLVFIVYVRDREYKIEKGTMENLIDSIDFANKELHQQYDSLASIIDNEKKIIDTLRNYDHSIGSPLCAGGSFDNNWVLWINVKRPIRINSSYVKAQEDGDIEIVLYDGAYDEKQTKMVRVDKDFKKVRLNFEIRQAGVYAIGIKEGTKIGLQYHSVKEEEFQNYENFYLSICGSSKKGVKEIQKKYYQYFYDIDFTPLTNDK